MLDEEKRCGAWHKLHVSRSGCVPSCFNRGHPCTTCFSQLEQLPARAARAAGAYVAPVVEWVVTA
jgi:hypothetical protein